MAKKNKITASRGSVNSIILNCLLSGDKYGYEIIKEVEQQTNGKVKLKQPSLYSSLKRFEEKGYIDSYWGDSDIGGRRHYYTITKLGRENATQNKKGPLARQTAEPKPEVVVNEPEIVEEETVLEPEQAEDEYLFDFEEDTEVTLQKQYNTFNVDDKIEELLNEEQELPTTYDEEEEQEYINEISEAVEEEKVELEEETVDKENNEDEEMIYDHHFYKSTPLTELTTAVQEEAEEEQDTEEAPTEDEKVEEEKPRPRIITDEFGITKMVYDDEVKPTQPKIIDNVKYRTAPLQNVYDSPKSKPHKVLFEDISEEEREIKNQKFMQKFDSITQEKSSDAVFNKDYKKKLFSLYDDNSNETVEVVEEKPVFVAPTPQVYDEPTYYEEVEPVRTEMVPTTDYTLKRIEKENKTSFKNNYLLVNKAKFIFGIVMLVVMLLQVTITLMVLKQNNLLFSKHFWVYQVSYTITALITLYYCIPVFISPNKQASHTYRLKYSLMFGLLAFLVSLLLIYSINTFMGFEYSNAKFFLSTLLVPSILATNFVLGPIIFKVITLNKKLY